MKLDIVFQVRCGSNLILPNVKRNVTKESIHMPVIRRRVLKSLGYDNREMLTAARENMEKTLISYKDCRKIAMKINVQVTLPHHLKNSDSTME